MRAIIVITLVAGAVPSAGAVDPWATYRGNVQRTGHTDGQPGPAALAGMIPP